MLTRREEMELEVKLKRKSRNVDGETRDSDFNSDSRHIQTTFCTVTAADLEIKPGDQQCCFSVPIDSVCDYFCIEVWFNDKICMYVCMWNVFKLKS